MAKKEYIGKQFGRLVVIGEVPIKERQCKCRLLICKCECGKILNVRAPNLDSGNTLSCGCLAKELARERYERPVIGERFGRLVGKSTYYDEKGLRHAICICDCGKEKVARVGDLFSGMTRSCGCLRSEISHKRGFEDISGQTFNELTAIKRVDDQISSLGVHTIQYLFRCSCGREIIAAAGNVKQGKTKSCGHIGKSYAEYQIFNFLQKHQIKFDYNGKIKGLINPDTNRPLFVDFIVYKTDGTFIIIEHQGEQHFYPVTRKSGWNMGIQQREITDSIKKEFCKNNNILLYETLYNEDYISHLKTILIENNLYEGGEEDGDSESG